ncbi:MAG: metallophosphoesterase family protein, partial [Candidatus Omnitrophica bacterium]|nr:metallophosphoesterase family protein [Candidatus Omnitrophota bacterium]
MRIGVISDTHIPDISKNIPETILEDFKKTDMIIHVGDLVNLSVLDILRRSCPNVKAVYGNMDPFEVRKKLPEKEIIKVGNKKIGVTHGYGNPNKLLDIVTEIFKEDDVNLIIFGHSHKD